VQRFQVSGEGVQFVVVQLHRRHQATRFDGVGIANPQTEVLGSVCGYSGGNCVSTHQVSQVGAKTTICNSARNPVTVDAGGLFEDPLAFGRRAVDMRGLALLANPAIAFNRQENSPPRPKAIGIA